MKFFSFIRDALNPLSFLPRYPNCCLSPPIRILMRTEYETRKRALGDATSSPPKMTRGTKDGYDLARGILEDSFRQCREAGGAWYLDRSEGWVKEITRRFSFDSQLGPRTDEPRSDFVERLARWSAPYVSIDSCDFSRVRKVLRDAPVSAALPEVFRLYNSIERCGVTYALAMALLPAIKEIGTVFIPAHRFSSLSVRCYRSNMGDGPEAALPEAVAAVSGIVYDFMNSPSNLEVYGLLKGDWSFVPRSEQSVLAEYARVMNALASWDEDGTLVQRLERALPLFASIWGGDHSSLAERPARIFQIVTNRIERADAFLWGAGEYIDLARTVGRYGAFRHIIGAGTHAVVCAWKLDGREFAVRFLKCEVSDLHKSNEAGVRDLAVHCTINPENEDGHGGRASNVVRLIDHQLTVTRPSNMVPHRSHDREHPERLARLAQFGVWQVSVMEAFKFRAHEFILIRPDADIVRALVAQVAGFLMHAGSAHGFTHHDLGIGNIGCSFVPDSVKFLYYETAQIWVPTAHSRGALFKVYDFGMSRIGDRHATDSDAPLPRVSTGYNPAADLLCLASTLCCTVIFPKLYAWREEFGVLTVEMLSMVRSMLPMDVLDQAEPSFCGSEDAEVTITAQVSPTCTKAPATEIVEVSADVLFTALKDDLHSLSDFLGRLISAFRQGYGWPTQADFLNAQAVASNLFQRSFHCWSDVTDRQRNAVQSLQRSIYLSMYISKPTEAVPENTWILP